MEVTNTIERSQMMSVPMHPVHLVGKLTPASVGIHTEEDDADLMGTHYIPVNVQPSLSSNGELLTHQVVDLAGTEFVQHAVPTHYYDTEDILTQELTEDDRRLAAALVAVQFVPQSKTQQQQTVLTTDLLGSRPIVTLPNVSVDKPINTIVTSYMQAVQDDNVHQQIIDQHNQERIMKLYQNPPQELKLQPLPPLKKVLSSQSMMVDGSKYVPRHGVGSQNTGIGTVIEQVPQVPLVQEKSTNESELSSVTTQEINSSSKLLEDLDSDYDVESRPSHRSLPHKKRIPRKLKAPPARNIHAKCYKCNKCGETFNSQAAFSAHRASHSTPGNPKRPVNSFSCELCNKQFGSQLKFFEHLKVHYEPGGKEKETPLLQNQPNENQSGSSHPTIQDSFSIKTEFQQQASFF